MAKPSGQYWGQIFDNIHGFIKLTSTEEKIINSPYYQRLRWIKQLGFASYIFDGAEHTRFAHAIGVCHSSDLMVRALGLNVPDENFFTLSPTKTKEWLFHQSVRISALLHDVGTFPFSHSIEGAYIEFGNELDKKGKLPGKRLPNNHEHLGSFIIKNTDFPGGITRILKESGLDYAEISKIIKGESTDILANQILHSDLDADRMDYLIRDSHHTGIKYGQIDRDYILYHLTTIDLGKNKKALAVKENAQYAVEDFLIARFAWYSQVVRNSSSAKYDVLAAHIAKYLLEKKQIFRFDTLLEMTADPELFFTFNDTYFIHTLQSLYLSKQIKDKQIVEQIRMLLYRIPPKTVRIPESEHRILELDNSGGASQKELAIKQLQDKLDDIRELFKKHGKGTEWIIADIPKKDVIFTKMFEALMKSKKTENIFMERDPIKILTKNGTPRLLVEQNHALMGRLSRLINFIPNVYANESAIELLKAKRIIKA